MVSDWNVWGRVREVMVRSKALAEAMMQDGGGNMGLFLNTAVPFEAYSRIVNTRFFVDKSLLLAEILEGMGHDGQRYVCITRPRRFGKTVMAAMIAAFMGKAADSRGIFEQLAISEKDVYDRHLNRYNVIFIDFSRLPENSSSYERYIARISEGIKKDIIKEFPDQKIDLEQSIWDILTEISQKTGDKFVFVMDEWDAVFHMPSVTEKQRKEYLGFLKNLLKDQEYVELAYMTGILPIAKYSDGSELNMFDEYDMATRERYGQYFGFLEEEVDRLYETYSKTTRNPKVSRAGLREWYDGYHTASGDRLYNPRSVVCALRDNQLAGYWTSSGTYDSIFSYIKGNVEAVREDLVLMVSGQRVEAKMRQYAATASELNTRNQIYSAMVVYGLLTYEEGQVFIPNKELMEKFDELLLSNESLGYVNRLARESERMLRATLAGDTQTMAEIFKFAHDTESPILSYNSEIELSAVVNLVYLAARDRYRVEREDKAGRGYVDFIFYPERKNEDALILELKVDSTPEAAIQQIKDKGYALRLKGKLGEMPKYTGRTLAVGISYDRKTKEHHCKVETL